MFYSQFILAKKGPLGTIWIAAHLERKLRKNQVADTDIGVSVDSILSPDIPIALRLSSHLLLGVVRIYSRKVNYLFHDCSETLLKVKQAFRSAVVDLPPEESTAPYHSITLPETFDLEEFVLPDSLNGNFVDHHVSTREQITLQDSIDGTGHSTLQFEPDERFGDGDAPQIALDLDEEMFLDKGLTDHNASAPLALEEKIDIQLPGLPETPFTGMDIDDCQEVGTPKDMPSLPGPDAATSLSDLHGYNIHTPDLNDIIFPSEDVGAPSAVPNEMEVSYPQSNGPHRELREHAEAPSTPGLAEEANPSRVHETPAFSPQGKTSASNIVDDFVSETEKGFQDKCQNGSNRPLIQSCDERSGRASVRGEGGQNICEASGHELCHNNATHKTDVAMGILTQEVQVENRTSELNGRLDIAKTDMLDPQYQNIEKEVNGCFSGHKTTLGYDSSLKPCTSQLNHIDISTLEGLNGRLDIAKTDMLDQQYQNIDKEVNGCFSGHKTSLGYDSSLKPCTSQLNHIDISTFEGEQLGENISQPAKAEILLGGCVRNAEYSSLERQGDGLDFLANQELNHISNCLPCKSKEDCSKQDELPTIIPNDTQCGVLNFSASSGYPEPEKMLLAPSGDRVVENDLALGTSDREFRDPDGRVDGNQCLSGKKRYMVEKTPDLQSDSSVKVFNGPQLKGRIDHIPNDDDLLASILVGRGASTLKMKSTPSLPSVPSSKRSRLTPKIGAPKRKMHLDDTMVLHADVIREQLISTEDIHRTRRKAACTRSDICMIQKAFSEDETFGESVLTGMSAELTSLHYQTYELNGIGGYRDDANYLFSDALKTGLTDSSKITENASDGGQMNPFPLVSEGTASPLQTTNSPAQTVAELCVTDENSHEQDHLSSEPLNDKTNLLPHRNSYEEVVHHPEKDERTVLSANDCITKEGPTITESINTDIINQPSLSSQDHTVEFRNVTGETFSLVDTSCIDVANEKPTEPTVFGDANICIHDFPEEKGNSVDPSVITNDEGAAETGDGQLEVSFDDQIGSSLCLPESSNIKTVLSPSEITCMEGPGLQNNVSVDVQDVPGYPATKDSDGYGSVTGGNVIDFLVDDEVDNDEEIIYDIPNTEAQSLENFGWSVRTRGVARYLRLLFDNDSGFGRKTAEMDCLLAGKTRKEASRMFFETLVLKTKDYVDVEQGSSFENINIKPTAKLLKSEF